MSMTDTSMIREPYA